MGISDHAATNREYELAAALQALKNGLNSLSQCVLIVYACINPKFLIFAASDWYLKAGKQHPFLL
jgi:hypothetical protein